MKIIFTIIMLIHGLIHLMGFLNAFEINWIDQSLFSNRYADTPRRILGALWLATAVCFIVTFGMYLQKSTHWWLFSLIAIALSQILIFFFWKDARYGTLANLILLFPTLLSMGSYSFQKIINEDTRKLTEAVKPYVAHTISAEDIAPLPDLLSRYLENVGVPGYAPISQVHVQQECRLRTQPNADWIEGKATHFAVTNAPGFVWHLKADDGKMSLEGRDLYQGGNGKMLIKAFSLIPVVNVQSAEIGHSASIRFLSEMIWYPTAMLNEYVTWTQLNDHQVLATLEDGKNKVQATFHFNEEGLISKVTAERYYETGKKIELKPWEAQIDTDSYQSFEGILIPTRAKLIWQLEDGPFHWFDLKITDVEFE